MNSSEIIVNTCMAVKKTDSVLIITDFEKREIGKALEDAAKKITEKVQYVEIEIVKNHGEEPLAEISKMMKNYDVLLLPTSKSLSHTKARRDATENGARIASMPTITKDILNRCIDIDYEELKVLHKKIRELLLTSKEIRITTEAGSNIITSVTEVHGATPGIYTESGLWGNLPTGEVDSGVKNTNGTLVVDASFGGLGKMKSPLTLIIKNNKVESIKGEQAEKLKLMLDKFGENAYKIAELGIGTNENAIVTGCTLEDEKVKGTFHMAVGNDLTYGGKNDVSIHLDGIAKKPTIYIDDKKIMEDGEFLL